jgi:hypothetical protein
MKQPARNNKMPNNDKMDMMNKLLRNESGSAITSEEQDIMSSIIKLIEQRTGEKLTPEYYEKIKEMIMGTSMQPTENMRDTGAVMSPNEMMKMQTGAAAPIETARMESGSALSPDEIENMMTPAVDQGVMEMIKASRQYGSLPNPMRRMKGE